jgi:hypothetical protein
MKAASRPKSRKYSATVVDKVLLPYPAKPCSQRTFFLSDGVVNKLVINLSISWRVPGKHSDRDDASMWVGFSLRVSMLTVIFRFSKDGVGQSECTHLISLPFRVFDWRRKQPG